MKKILLSALFLLCLSPFLKAQEEEDWSIPVSFTGQNPVISDFLTALLTRDYMGDSFGGIHDKWESYRLGRPLSDDCSFLVDQRNGYIRFDSSYTDEFGTYSSTAEYCFWNCSDGRHKLVAENMLSFKDGEPFESQMSGLSLYMYDSGTKKMVPVYAYDLGLDLDDVMPLDTNITVRWLPRTGKTIQYIFYAPSGDAMAAFTWDGRKFKKAE